MAPSTLPGYSSDFFSGQPSEDGSLPSGLIRIPSLSLEEYRNNAARNDLPAIEATSIRSSPNLLLAQGPITAQAPPSVRSPPPDDNFGQPATLAELVAESEPEPKPYKAAVYIHGLNGLGNSDRRATEILALKFYVPLQVRIEVEILGVPRKVLDPIGTPRKSEGRKVREEGV